MLFLSFGECSHYSLPLFFYHGDVWCEDMCVEPMVARTAASWSMRGGPHVPINITVGRAGGGVNGYHFCDGQSSMRGLKAQPGNVRCSGNVQWARAQELRDREMKTKDINT